MHEKGKYYKIILNIMGCDGKGRGGVDYIFKNQIKGIYDTIPHYYKDVYVVNKEEFIFSMRWALADVFGDGCEVEEPENLFADI
jgi:hypothetical protein